MKAFCKKNVKFLALYLLVSNIFNNFAEELNKQCCFMENTKKIEEEKKYEKALAKAKTFIKRWQGIEAPSSELAIKELKDIFPELNKKEYEMNKEHRPLEWSEEDELMFTSIIKSLELTNGAAQMKIDWLKSLKDRCMSQQNCASETIEWNGKIGSKHAQGTLKEMLDEKQHNVCDNGDNEKIRKDIIRILKGELGYISKEDTDKYIAWIEKQGEYANFRSKIQIGDKVTRNDSGVLVNLSQFERVAKETEKQCKKVEPNYKIIKGKNYFCVKTHNYAGVEWIKDTKYYASDNYTLVNQGCECYCPEYSKEEHNNLFEEVKYDDCVEKQGEQSIEEIENPSVRKYMELDKFALANMLAERDKNSAETIKAFDELEKPVEWNEEDDKIRQTIIREFEQCSEWYCANGLTKEDCIAWLEKQGKQKPYPATLEKAIELYYFTYGNGNGGFDNLSLEKFKDIVKTFVEDYGEQKSVEWSEEDEEISAAIIKRIKGESYALSVSLSSAIGWIRKVKDRVIPQPKEWSEEDEKFFKTALWHISYSISNGKSTDIHCDTTDWFKSIKERFTWKPSDEQMDTLKQWLKDKRYDGDARHCFPIFDSLYQDLKKLKEK